MQTNYIGQKAITQWFIDSDEPWTRYRAYVDLLRLPVDDPDVAQAREEMLAHPQVQELLATAGSWPGYALKRHNDARHPMFSLPKRYQLAI